MGGRRNRKPIVLAKTGGLCAYCRKPVTLDTVTIDHIIPLAKGGSWKISNLNPSCRKCNNSKADKTLWDEFTPKNLAVQFNIKDLIRQRRFAPRERLIKQKRLNGVIGDLL